MRRGRCSEGVRGDRGKEGEEMKRGDERVAVMSSPIHDLIIVVSIGCDSRIHAWWVVTNNMHLISSFLCR